MGKTDTAHLNIQSKLTPHYSKNAESMISDVFRGVQHMTKLVFTGHYINFCQSVCKLSELEKGLVC